MSIAVTLYKRPNGASETITVANIRDEDAEWFKANNANLSMEDIGGQMAVYADVGLTIDNDPDEDPAEAIELSRGRSAEDTFSALRKQCEEMLLAA